MIQTKQAETHINCNIVLGLLVVTYKMLGIPIQYVILVEIESGRAKVYYSSV
jgi:hypothetical protein